ncbi:MAG: hypothetical protein HFI75_10845 [Lachnospiraceae bacterium]|nr:hypothetical protein [Lachnospiraceae bacterium]
MKNATICVIKNAVEENVLKDTYKKCCRLAERYKGYIDTSELLLEGLTNRQISEFVANGMLEKVCYGTYWFDCAEYVKPDAYKAIEICRSNPKAVICADSACFYQGLIEIEPSVVSIATRRDDRSKFAMNFPVSRHYYSSNYFAEHQKVVETEFGQYIVYDVERSVCDCIRFKKYIDEDIFCLVIDCYRKQKKAINRLTDYAEKLHMLNQVKKYL